MTPKTFSIRTPAELGQLVTQLRSAAGDRQDSFAANVGIGVRTLRAIEHGRSGVAVGTILDLLADLGVTLEAQVDPGLLEAGAAQIPAPRASGRPIGKIKTTRQPTTGSKSRMP